MKKFGFGLMRLPRRIKGENPDEMDEMDGNTIK